MPELSPLDNPDTYRQMAEAAYRARRAPMNPGAVLASRMATAEGGAAPQIPPTGAGAAPAAMVPGVQFNKPFSPQERAAQRAALIRKLQELDAEDAAQQPQAPMPGVR